MDISVKHEPLTIYEDKQFLELYDKRNGQPVFRWFSCVVFFIMVCFMLDEMHPAPRLIIAAVLSLVLNYAVKKTLKDSKFPATRRLLEQLRGYTEVQTLRFTDDSYHKEIPGISTQFPYKLIDKIDFYKLPNGDMVAVFWGDAFMIIRKSDFPSGEDYQNLMEHLKKQGVRIEEYVQ